ncbi:MAG: pilus assembly protein TadG-related protein [Actinobacteria bacterium]|nr:pilus assembly protein TadG-related protein [Actinomycetota bacterium]
MSEGQSGQLMIIVAVGLVVILGFAALVMDLGNGYSQRRLAQNAADGAALAAMRMVRMSPSDTPGSTIYSEIIRLASLNGGAQVDSANTLFLDVNKNSLGPVNGHTGSLNQVAGVRVSTRIQYNTLFAGIIGINSLTSGGKATAMSLAIQSLSSTGVWPIVTKQQSFTVGSVYTIWDDNKEAAGNAGWVDLDGGSGSASELASWVSDGFHSSDSEKFEYYDDAAGPSPGTSHESESLPFPSWLETTTGNKSSALGDMRTGQSITVLLFSQDNGESGSNLKYRATGLAQFTITSVSATGHPKSVQGTFERMVLPGDPSSTPTTSEMSTVRLTN